MGITSLVDATICSKQATAQPQPIIERRHSVRVADTLHRIDVALCPYCAPGSGYVIPNGGCDHGRSAPDEFLEMRRAMLTNGIRYSSGGTILSVR